MIGMYDANILLKIFKVVSKKAIILNMELCILLHILGALSMADITTASTTSTKLGTMTTNNWTTTDKMSSMETSNNTQSTLTTMVTITRNLTTTQESAISQNVTITAMPTVRQTVGQTTSTWTNEENSKNTETTIDGKGTTKQTKEPEKTTSIENIMLTKTPSISSSTLVAAAGAPEFRNVAIVSVVLVVLLFTLIAVGYFCYKKKNKNDTPGLGLGVGVRVSGGGTKNDRNTFVPNFVEKDNGHDRYVLEPTIVDPKHMSVNIYGDAGDMADPEFRLSVR